MAAPELDAPLTRLSAGENGRGIWVAAQYQARGYAAARAYLWTRAPVAERLASAANAVRAHGFAILVWDAWRSRELQRTLWEEYRSAIAASTGMTGDALDARTREFVSSPETTDPPPPHLTGGALDVTLCTLDGEAIDMGGEFDELSERTHPDYYEREDLTPEEAGFRDRRRVLCEAMIAAGFVRFPTEWWHFEWGTHAWAAERGASEWFGEAAAPAA